ncbi:MAG: hypothetical protein OSJ39_00270 [Clostridia bacterium]|nr:hypothetical protein [Clostridia bacterium]
MFIETDEIFVWAKKGRKNKAYKLKTSAAVKQMFVGLFNNGINSLMQDENGDEREPIPFENNYLVTTQDENFIIRAFVVPQELQEAIDAPDVVENYVPIDEKGKTRDGYEIRAVLIGSKDEHGYYFAGQRFTQRQVMLKPKGINILFQQDMFVVENRGFSINIGETLDCVFIGDGLIFEKYNDANGVFDLSEYYRTASQNEVDQFSNNPAFEIEDSDAFDRAVAGISMRKKIAKIIDLGTLNDVEKIRNNAVKVNIDIEFTDDGSKVKIPEDKKELKKVMAFLAEELYPGLFTNNTYLSNSTRKVE